MEGGVRGRAARRHAVLGVVLLHLHRVPGVVLGLLLHVGTVLLVLGVLGPGVRRGQGGAGHGGRVAGRGSHQVLLLLLLRMMLLHIMPLQCR